MIKTFSLLVVVFLLSFTSYAQNNITTINWHGKTIDIMPAFDMSSLESNYTDTKSVSSNQINKNVISLPVKILSGDFEEISVYDNDTLFAGKTFSGLYRTTEGPFANWDEISSEGVTKVTVNGNNPSNIFLCAGTSGLFVSTDFGRTWTNISSGLQLGSWESVMDLVIDPKNSQHLFCATSGIDKRDLYESTDGGVTWVSKNINANVTTLKYVPNTDTLFTAYESVLLVSTDNGGSWTRISTFENFIGDFVLPENISDEIFIAVKDSIYKTTDLGQNWEARCNGIDGNQIRQLVVSKINPDKLFALSDYDKIYYTNDAGENWEIFYSADSMTIKKIALSSDEEYLYMTSSDGLYLFNLLVGIDEEITANPSMFTLYQNYPNPFNPTTTIKYVIPANTGVETLHATSLRIYNILGEEVATLVNKQQTPGNYTVQFYASNLPSGVYFYTLRVGDFTATKKMILLK